MFDKSFDELEDLLRSYDVEECKEALTFVGRYRRYELTHVVQDLMRRRNREVQRIAQWAYSRLKSPELVPILIESLTDPSIQISTNASWLLIQIAHETVPTMVVPDLIEVLFEAEESLMRQMAFVTLGEIHSVEAMEAVERYLGGGRSRS